MVCGVWTDMSTPISSITSWTKPSALPERTPAERAMRRPGKYLRASAAAIGERTEFIEQTKSTVGRLLSRSSMRRHRAARRRSG